MVGLHRPVLGIDGGAFDQRQQVALNTLTRHIGAAQSFAAGDLVDLVEEYDSVLLNGTDRLLHQLFVVEKFVGFFVDQNIVRFINGDTPRLGAAATKLSKNV